VATRRKIQELLNKHGDGDKIVEMLAKQTLPAEDAREGDQKGRSPSPIATHDHESTQADKSRLDETIPKSIEDLTLRQNSSVLSGTAVSETTRRQCPLSKTASLRST